MKTEAQMQREEREVNATLSFVAGVATGMVILMAAFLVLGDWSVR